MNAAASDPRAGILAALARLDAAGAQARSALEAGGIESVLLKGRAFAHRLYDHVWERPYADTDVLVRASATATRPRVCSWSSATPASTAMATASAPWATRTRSCAPTAGPSICTGGSPV